MECTGPRCVADLLEWLKAQLLEAEGEPIPTAAATTRQGSLWTVAPYQDEAPALRTPAELAGAIEYLEYAVFRRFQNVLTRAERARLDNTIQNALFKAERYLGRLEGAVRDAADTRLRPVQEAFREGRDRAERLRNQARRADLKLAQLGNLSPEQFEEFVAEVFEALGYQVECVGGTGDEGADLRLVRDGLRAVAQCKYHKTKGVIGSPDLQKFLGTVHHTGSHKGYFVTTRTFSLAAEKFAAEHPIELVDGPRLIELVEQALGPAAKREPSLFGTD
jgi:restriction system protein